MPRLRPAQAQARVSGKRLSSGKEDVMKVKVICIDGPAREVELQAGAQFADAISVAEMPTSKGYVRLLNGAYAREDDNLKHGDVILLVPLLYGSWTARPETPAHSD